jgi:hypothetical protein
MYASVQGRASPYGQERKLLYVQVLVLKYVQLLRLLY